jgi:CRP-like cAMP-binding protein
VTATAETTIDQPISLDTVVRFLVATPFFSGLDAAERGEVVRIMEVKRLQNDEEIFHEGDPGDAWYVVFEGKVKVLKEMESGPSQVATLGPGACFGEMAIHDGMARSATVRADGPLTMFKFRRARFEQLLEEGSLGAYKLIAAMARLLSQRQRELAQQVGELLAGKGTPTAVKSMRASIVEAVGRSTISE